MPAFSCGASCSGICPVDCPRSGKGKSGNGCPEAVIFYLMYLLWLLLFAPPPALDLHSMIEPVPESAKLVDPDYYIWCGAMVQASDGKYHLYYSRWRRELGFAAWVTHSEVAHAVG